MNNKRQGGLTLLEMLVVISLTAMLSALMFQGYGYLLGRYDYVKNRQSLAQRTLLVHGWFRETSETMVPYYEGSLRFSGSGREIAGASYAPLFGPAGVPTPVSWSLEKNDGAEALWYREADAEPIEIWRWPPGLSASFRFRGNGGRDWNEAWDTTQADQLPAGVQLLVRGVGEPEETITAAIATRRRQEVYTDDILFGRE